jgi:hypothetical protein
MNDFDNLWKSRKFASKRIHNPAKFIIVKI